jgi:hypothetical protein
VQLLRVGKVHYAQHGSRLLMGRATITRKGVLTIGVTSSKTKTSRTFDVEDGPDGQITEQIDQTDLEFDAPNTPRSGPTSFSPTFATEGRQFSSSSTCPSSPRSFASFGRKEKLNRNTTDSSIFSLSSNPPPNSPLQVSSIYEGNRENALKRSLKTIFAL